MTLIVAVIKLQAVAFTKFALQSRSKINPIQYLETITTSIFYDPEIKGWMSHVI